MTTSAHDGNTTHHYMLHFPAHEPRESDPHYRDFDAYRRKTHKTAQCSVGLHRNDFSECKGQLELHHSRVEFALMNNVDLAWLEKDYPGISDPDQVGAWIESAENLMWLCEWHHRGHGGVHCATYADFEAGKYVRGLIT